MGSLISALPARQQRRIGAAVAVGGVVLMGTSIGLTDASSPVNAGASITALPAGPVAGIQGYHVALAPTGGDLTTPSVRLMLPVGEQVFLDADVPGQYSTGPNLPVLPAFCGAGSELGQVIDDKQQLVCNLPDVKADEKVSYEFFTAAMQGRTGADPATAEISAGSIVTVHTDTTGKSWTFDAQGNRQPLTIHKTEATRPQGTLVGTTWLDSSKDGKFDTDEALLAGTTAVIRPLTPAPGEKTEISVRTNAQGEFSKSGLTPGAYVVSFIAPEGFIPNTETSFEVEVSHVEPVSVSAGFVSATGDVSGVIWNDNDADGKRDQGEGPLGSVGVTLVGTDQTGNPVSLTATTNPDGGYLFGDIGLGTYDVTVAADAGTRLVTGPESFGESASVVLTAEAPSVSDLDTASTERVAQVQGRIQSHGQGDVAQVAVRVTGQDANGKVSVKTTTDAEGNYSVSNLLPGEYQVRIGDAEAEDVVLTAAAPQAKVTSTVDTNGATATVVENAAQISAKQGAAPEKLVTAAKSEPTAWLLLPIALLIVGAGFFAQWRLNGRRHLR